MVPTGRECKMIAYRTLAKFPEAAGFAGAGDRQP